jgi:Dolichyl-phosphate-mannose-protein mannosyltransferase
MQRWIRIPAVQVGLVASILSIAAFAYYSHAGLLFAYPDAVSHFMIARRVLASRTPGLAQFGATWPPLPHALMLPLIWVDVLWRDGLAGGLPSMLAYVVAGIYMFRLGKLVLKSDIGGYLAALALVLNPSLIYLQATAMSETDLIACTVILAFYLVRWTQDESWNDLIKCSAACCAATLIRYDGWALTAAAASVVMYTTYRRHGWIRARAAALLFGLLGLAGCVGWVVYSQVVFHSALYFLVGPYSSSRQQHNLETRSGIITHHQLLLSIHTYIQAVVDNVGLLVVVAAGAGLAIHLVGLFGHSRTRLATCVLLVPFAFSVLSLYLGINPLRTPEITGPGQTPTYYGGRYALEPLPAVALFFSRAVKPS